MISRRALVLTTFAALALGPAWAAAPTLTADQILARIDQNLTFESRSSRMTMTVTKNGRVKSYEIVSYGRGAEEGASEYLSPARDAGTKMLKKGDELWMYMPSVEKVQKISGHMLRQGMMGSDLSYEDMLESDDWRSNYNAVALPDEPVNGRACWVLDLTAKSEDVSYPRRKVWVDQEWLLPVRQELYALSGMLLKVWIMSDPKRYGDRWYPMKMTVEDKLQQGSKTEIVFTELLFSVPLEEEIFTTRWLERR